jgi:WD40 repeat protein
MDNKPRLDNSTNVDNNTYFGNTANPETQQVVEEIAPNDPIEAEMPQKANILAINSRGKKVLKLQKQLLQLGFLMDGINPNADGIFGLSTRDAVRDFQQSVGIEADGIVGPQTWSMLQELVEKSFAKFDSPLHSIAISPDGYSVVAGLENGNLEMRSLTEGNITQKTLQGHDGVILSVSFSPDGQTLASSAGNTIKLWKIETEKELRTLVGHENFVTSVSFSPDRQTLASASRDNTIKLWNIETGKEIRTLKGHEEAVFNVSFSHDGQILASGSVDQTIKLWNVKTGKEIRTLVGHENFVTSVSFSPDGQTLASGDEKSQIKLWKVKTGQELRTLTGHEEAIWSVSFSPDSQTLASASWDNTIKLWNVETGKEIRTLTGHEEAVNGVIFLLGGQVLVSGSSDCSVRLWDVKTGKQLSGLPMLPIKISIGQELQNDLPQGNDQLNIKTEIDALTNVLMLRELKPPLAVGILGGWGSGKSFALHLMKERINEIRSEALTEKQAWGEGDQLFPYVGHIYQIEFDAWTYAKADLWSSLMQTILYEFNRQLTLEKQIEQQLRGEKKNPLLQGHKIWKVLNKMNDSDREIILSKLSQLKEENNTGVKDVKSDEQITDYLWNKISELRQKEKEQLSEKNKELIKEKQELRTLILVRTPIYFLQENWLSILGFCFGLLITLYPTLPKDIKNGLFPDDINNALSALPLATLAGGIGSAASSGKNLIQKTREQQNKLLNNLKEYQEKIQKNQREAQDFAKAAYREVLEQDEEITKKLQNIQALENQINQQQQQLGVSSTYPSLNTFVTDRLQANSYNTQLGFLQQVQRDLADLTEHFTFPDHSDFNKEQFKGKIETIQKIFPRGPARVVLYIDDLDRCPPHKVVEVLEAVQLLVKTSLFIVVLAIDDRYISRALEDVYKGVLKRRGQPSGIDYLEKIIQIPYRMRSISPSNLKSYLEFQMTIEEEQIEQPKTVSTPKKSTSKSPKIPDSEIKKTNLEPELSEKETLAIPPVKTPEPPKPPQTPETISEIIKFTRSEFDLLANCCKHVDRNRSEGV